MMVRYVWVITLYPQLVSAAIISNTSYPAVSSAAGVWTAKSNTFGTATYTGTLPSVVSSFTSVVYTNTPQDMFTFTPPSGVIVLGIYLIGSLKNDRQAFLTYLTANGTQVDETVSQGSAYDASATSGNGQLYALASYSGLDVYTNYQLVVVNGAPNQPSGYLAFQGVLVTTAGPGNGDALSVQQDSVTCAVAPQGVDIVGSFSPVPPYNGLARVGSQGSTPTSPGSSPGTTPATPATSPPATTPAPTQPAPTQPSTTSSSKSTATVVQPTGLITPLSAAPHSGPVPLYAWATGLAVAWLINSLFY